MCPLPLIQNHTISLCSIHNFFYIFNKLQIIFGFKYWCLTFSEGYCYQFISYGGGSSENNTEFGFGESVVLKLLSHLDDPDKDNNIR